MQGEGKGRACVCLKNGGRARSLQTWLSRNGRARGLSPNPRALPCLPAKLLNRGEQSLFRGGRVLGAQLSFRPAFGQLVGLLTAFHSDLRKEVLVSVVLEDQHGIGGGLFRIT